MWGIESGDESLQAQLQRRRMHSLHRPRVHLPRLSVRPSVLSEGDDVVGG
jgi:hypothetical protein